MTFEQMTAAIRPKVQGTRNLHEYLPKDLDFFVMLFPPSLVSPVTVGRAITLRETLTKTPLRNTEPGRISVQQALI